MWFCNNTSVENPGGVGSCGAIGISISSIAITIVIVVSSSLIAVIATITMSSVDVRGSSQCGEPRVLSSVPPVCSLASSPSCAPCNRLCLLLLDSSV